MKTKEQKYQEATIRNVTNLRNSSTRIEKYSSLPLPLIKEKLGIRQGDNRYDTLLSTL